MHFSRIMVGGLSLPVLSMCLALKTCSADVTPKLATLTVPCTYTINVDPTYGVKEVDAYICNNTTVTWAANKHTFHVFFKKNKCPFKTPANCKGISDKNPQATVDDIKTFTIFDYGIVVDDDLFDPHVVGGGGNLVYSDSASK
jgi:hypothetical protein